MNQDNNRIIIFDTTLRDGEQSPGATMNFKEKIEIAHQLARLGVDVIEAGFPISSVGDFEAVSAVAQEVQGPIICGLARAMEKDVERCGQAVTKSSKPRIHTFIATSQVHLEKKLRMSKDKVIETAVKAVTLAKSFTPDVEFSCEDAGRTDWTYMSDVISAVIEAGATTINVPDTVGYTNPWQFGDCMAYLRQHVRGVENVIFSVHCHNDLGLAVANSLAAVRQGARQVECTINGIGERAGNCSLEEFVMNLAVRKDFYGLTTNVKTSEIYRSSRLVSKITGIRVQRNKAVVGANAFAHEAGIHQDGVLKERTTYEIMSAEDVGWTGESMVLGKHSGRHAFKTRLGQLGYELSDEDVNKAFERFKQLCDKKKDIYDEDLFAIVEDAVLQVEPTYQLVDFSFTGGTASTPSATLTLARNGDSKTVTINGDGPVDAAFKAAGEITSLDIKLKDFTIEAVTGGGDAVGQVAVQIEVDGRTVKARGSDTDIVVASVKAYVNAVNKLLAMRDKDDVLQTANRGM